MQFISAMMQADWTPDQLVPRRLQRRRWRAVGILGRFRATGAEGRERGLAERRAAAAAATAASEGIREERRGERRNGGVRGGRPVGDGTLRSAREGGVSIGDSSALLQSFTMTGVGVAIDDFHLRTSYSDPKSNSVKQRALRVNARYPDTCM